ncbi:MAG TPA: 2-isopropylmalate synthase [Polyangiaceae bacterium]|nr:2-isopropylmalate synthase [Polyangiaceae bacterium]
MAFDFRKYAPFAPIQKPDRRWPSRVIERAPVLCAVDLRDGNQALVRPMTVEQKKRLFSLLVRIGVKEIEVGFPSASQPDFDFVRALIEENLVPEDVTIQVLTQAREDLIARTFESLDGARRAIVHLYNSTSTVQRERVFGMDRDGIRGIAVRGAECILAHALARPGTEWIFEYSPESFTGTELDFAAEVVNAVLAVYRPDLGRKVIVNLPATVEMSTPNVYADMIEWMTEHIDHRELVQVSLHTHNDRGTGVAAAELGVMAGADRVEGTLLGNGERTGNMDLVTFAMNLYSQGIDPKIDLSDMRTIIETVEYCTDIETHPRHPWAGELVYTAFSGSHQDAIRKSLHAQRPDEPWQVAYLPIDPSDLGRRYEEVVRINSQSGKGGVLHVLERDHGITLPRWLQIELSRVVQQEAERDGGEVEAERVRRLFDETYVTVPAGFRMDGYAVSRDSGKVRAEVQVGGRTVTGEGGGTVEALLAAVAPRGDVRVEAFDEMAVERGTTATAMASVRLACGGETSVGVAFAADTTGAAFQAVLTALGRLGGFARRFEQRFTVRTASPGHATRGEARRE